VITSQPKHSAYAFAYTFTYTYTRNLKVPNIKAIPSTITEEYFYTYYYNYY